MGLQVLNEGVVTNSVIMEEAYEAVDAETDCKKNVDVDVRRRLEDKLEDLKLQKDVQEYDFDW